MVRKAIWWTLTLLCAAVILSFSCQTAEQSAGISGSLTNSLLAWIPFFKTLSAEMQQTVQQLVHTWLRAAAHVFTFAVLGFCSAMLARSYRLCRWMIVAFFGCFVFAICDETVQLVLRAGRAFEMVDLLKDWAGSFMGILLVMSGIWIRNRRKREDKSNGISCTGA